MILATLTLSLSLGTVTGIDIHTEAEDKIEYSLDHDEIADWEYDVQNILIEHLGRTGKAWDYDHNIRVRLVP
jgi:hypothetical protein